MMFRPTESRILWLQQFAEASAKRKARITHRDRLHRQPPYLLQAADPVRSPPRDAAIHEVPNSSSGEAKLPPGCEVTYDLQALISCVLCYDVPDGDVLRFEYDDFDTGTGDVPQPEITTRV